MIPQSHSFQVIFIDLHCGPSRSLGGYFSDRASCCNNTVGSVPSASVICVKGCSPRTSTTEVMFLDGGGEGRTLLRLLASLALLLGMGELTVKMRSISDLLFKNRTKQKQTFSPKVPTQIQSVLRKLPPAVYITALPTNPYSVAHSLSSYQECLPAPSFYLSRVSLSFSSQFKSQLL